MGDKRHILALDGLRGVAALAVFGLHLSQRFAMPYPFPRAQLAVDFFFLLSGFVVAFSYEGKLRDGLSLRRFAEIRAIRLYPMIIAGAALGLFAYPEWSFGQFLASAICLPIPSGGPDLFPLNGPEWSLFFELFANGLFAVALYRLSDRQFLILTAVASIVFIAICRKSGMIGGFTWANGWIGFPRVIMPFLLGMGLFRIHHALPVVKLPFVFACIGLLLLFAVPLFSRGEWLFTALVEFVALPGLIIVALNCSLGDRVGRVAKWAGDVSYPLYILHVPLIGLLQPRIGEALPGAPSMILTLLIVLGLAWVASKHVDAPLRAKLSLRRRNMPAALPA